MIGSSTGGGQGGSDALHRIARILVSCPRVSHGYGLASRPIRRTSPAAEVRVHQIRVTRLLNSVRIIQRGRPQHLPDTVDAFLRLFRSILWKQFICHGTRCGRSPAVNAAARFAKGDLLLTVDADTVFEPNAVP